MGPSHLTEGMTFSIDKACSLLDVTERQAEITAYASIGINYKRIAQRFNIPLQEVKNYVSDMYDRIEKLEVAEFNRTQIGLFVFYSLNGILNYPELTAADKNQSV